MEKHWIQNRIFLSIIFLIELQNVFKVCEYTLAELNYWCVSF